MRRWIGLSCLAVVALIAYQWLIAPSVGELRADLVFLRAARMQAIRQAQAPKAP